MKLDSLSDVFERRILRIPDYQRGYAWTVENCEYFWEDISHLDPKKIHYTGVITLEPVPESTWSHWSADQWIIRDRRFKPFYVVDGQQRLTTSMILLQAILEQLSSTDILNHQSAEEIRSAFILKKSPSNNSILQESFLFGYEIDNPSDEFLKTQIYGQNSTSNQHLLTLYTSNLANAKAFFKKKISVLNLEELDTLFQKLTLQLRFNLYEITSEIDVFVTFETMNNRGKKLSNLELLKNRLIYLSSLFSDKNPSDANILRKKINDVWKTIYEYLGKNPEAPLNDDTFLRNHWIMYFRYSRNKGDDYIKYLLEERFHAKNVLLPQSNPLTIQDIDAYVTNLQQSVIPWFYIHNPAGKLPNYSDQKNQNLVDRLHRLGFKAFRPLIVAAYVSKKPIEEINQMLIAMERYNFVVFTISQRRGNTGDSEFYARARELLNNKISIADVILLIDQLTQRHFDEKAFYNHIHDKYIYGSLGFYGWDGLRYFLFEHEADLQSAAKQQVSKINWGNLTAYKKDYATVEHILPQTPTDPYWVQHFQAYDAQQMRYLTHSLGNLVPLSTAKNSSLQNDPFPLKKDNQKGTGFYNGSAAENEVAKEVDWTATEILNRGMALLSFMEKRWHIKLGDDAFKRKLLHLEFL